MPEPAAPVVLLVHVAVAFVPGLAVGLALGLRGWLVAATAPLLTYGLVAIAAPALPVAGLGWSPWALAVVSTVATGLVLAARLLYSRLRPGPAQRGTPPAGWTSAHHGAVACAVATAAVLGGVLAHRATDGFTAVPQVWDAVFHANATRYIADTGFSDPAALRALNDPVVAEFYYPNAYHVIAATVAMSTDSTVTTTLDTHLALFPGLLALCLVTLVRQCGGRPALAAAVGLLSCAFTAFPYDLLPWGTLLPYIVALVLVPAFLALLATALRNPVVDAASVAVGIAAAGLLALHPGGAFTAAVFVIALVAQLWLQRGPRVSDLRITAVSVATALIASLPILRGVLGAASGVPYDWPATSRPADAMGQLFFLGHEQAYPQYWLVALGVLGLLRRGPLRPLEWFLWAGAFFAGLFVLSASYDGGMVESLTQPWWNDKWRLAAIWSLAGTLLAGAGLVALRDLVWDGLRRAAPAVERLQDTARVLASGSVLAVAAILVVVLSNGLYAERNETRLAQAFTDGPTVSTAERQAFSELARMVPAGSTVMNDPYDGSALMWALTDVRPVFATPVIAPHELPTMDPNRRVLFQSFNELDTNPAVQRAVRELDIRYAIIGTGLIAPARDHAPGMHDLDRVSALELVFSNGSARIYAVDQSVEAETE